MTKLNEHIALNKIEYIFDSRILTHGLFWLVYYVTFSLIWVRPENGYFASFYLEFLLLPARILCVYCVIYVLLPKYLLEKYFGSFLIYYIALLSVATSLQSAAVWYFYNELYLQNLDPQFDTASVEVFTLGHWIKSLMLVNSTVIFLSALKILKHYFELEQKQAINEQSKQSADKLTLVSDRRNVVVDTDKILYIQGMGNYVEVYTNDGNKLVTYHSIKSILETLPKQFVRVQKSYVVNANYIESFNNTDLVIKGVVLPRGKDITDEFLTIAIQGTAK